MATMAVAGLGGCEKGVLDGLALVNVTCDLQWQRSPLAASFLCVCVSGLPATLVCDCAVFGIECSPRCSLP